MVQAAKVKDTAKARAVSLRRRWILSDCTILSSKFYKGDLIPFPKEGLAAFTPHLDKVRVDKLSLLIQRYNDHDLLQNSLCKLQMLIKVRQT